MRKVTIGDATLYCGDMKKVLAKLEDKSVDLIWTDPPYGHNQNDGDLNANLSLALGKNGVTRGGVNTVSTIMNNKVLAAKNKGSGRQRIRDVLWNSGKPLPSRVIMNDGMEADDLVQVLFKEAARVLKKRSAICCCCAGGGGKRPAFALWALEMDKHLHFAQQVIWDKKHGIGWQYRRAYECVLVGHRKGGSLSWYDTTKKVQNVIKQGTSEWLEPLAPYMVTIEKIIPSAEDHPTQKPKDLIIGQIHLHTQPGDLVVDPFMGGGTTGVAAALTGRRFIGVELDEKFFELSVRRIKQAYQEDRGFLARQLDNAKKKHQERFGEDKRRRPRAVSLI